MLLISETENNSGLVMIAVIYWISGLKGKYCYEYQVLSLIVGLNRLSQYRLHYSHVSRHEHHVSRSW